MREDFYWKKIIEKFYQGIAIVKQNKGISYKNEAVNLLFGINNKD